MSIQVSRASEILNTALDYRAARQDLISSNIANADTPFYKPRDISFETALRNKQSEIFGSKKSQLEMAQTDGKHFSLKSEKSSTMATTFFRDGHMARNDGNSVDIDVETTEMSKNSVMFNALINAKRKDSAIFNSVIDASSKVS